MFTKNFYPTPLHLINLMVEGFAIEGKRILEPSAGKADIVNYLIDHGATVEACENNPDLTEIVKSRCKLVEKDFFNLTKERASHYDLIIMNPPFENGDRHLLHAYEIAAPGTSIICLLNANTLQNRHSRSRDQLQILVDAYGYYDVIENAFTEAERTTGVNVALVRMTKPGGEQRNEFQGFFMDGDPEQEQVNGLMSYNMIRDVVNRYTKAIEIFDEQLTTAQKLSDITGSFFSGKLGFQVTQQGTATTRAEFKKDLQKSAWDFIFRKLEMQKHTTQGLKEKINKFVETQQNIPFTMKNIYRMLEIVIATTGQRMDDALMEVFEKLTKHYKENRYSVEGWATNSHYLVNRRFILPGGFEYCKIMENFKYRDYSWYGELISDLEKALCFLTGTDWNKIKTETVHGTFGWDNVNNGQWYDTHFFKVKGFLKGTGHFEFKDENVWAMFNQRIATIMGFPLPEKAHTTKSEEKRREQKAKAWEAKSNPKTQNSQNDKRNPIIDQLIKEPINSETILNMFTQ